MSFLETLLVYYLCMSYINNCASQLKSQIADKNLATLYNLMKKFIVNLTKLQKLQTLYYNKYIKKRIY